LRDLPDHKLAELDHKIMQHEKKTQKARDLLAAEQIATLNKEKQLRSGREKQEKDERDYEYLM